MTEKESDTRRGVGSNSSSNGGRRALACEDAALRIVAQLEALASCVSTVAETGLLHYEIDCEGLQMRTTWRRVGGWDCKCNVTRIPTRIEQSARFHPDICHSVMSTIVCMSVLASDTEHELVEFEGLADVLSESLPTDAQLEQLHPGFLGKLRESWRGFGGGGSCGGSLIVRADDDTDDASTDAEMAVARRLTRRVADLCAQVQNCYRAYHTTTTTIINADTPQRPDLTEDHVLWHARNTIARVLSQGTCAL